MCENGASETNPSYRWPKTAFIACLGLQAVCVALLQITGSGSGSVDVQVSVSRLKECLPGARPFLMVKDRRARAKLIKHIYSFSSDFVHITFPHVPLAKPSHLIGLISTGKAYAGLEGEIFEPSALFCF